MPALLGRPAPGPVTPGPVPAEEIVDRGEVVGQVVLGQDVHEEGAGHPLGQGLGQTARAGGRQGPPLDDLVGEPLLGHAQVAVHQAFGRREQLGQQRRVIHGSGGLSFGLR